MVGLPLLRAKLFLLRNLERIAGANAVSVLN